MLSCFDDQTCVSPPLFGVPGENPLRYMFRRAASGGVAFAVAALTMVGLASTVAQADPVAPSLTCAPDTGSQQRTINCTVTAPDGNLHFVRVNNITLGHTFVVSSKLPCSTGGLGGAANLNFRAPQGNKYKITVADCAGNKHVYKIDKNGNVITPLHPEFSTILLPPVDGACPLTVEYQGLAPLTDYTLVLTDSPDLLPSTIPFTTDSTGSYVFLTSTVPSGAIYWVSDEQLLQAGNLIASFVGPFGQSCGV